MTYSNDRARTTMNEDLTAVPDDGRIHAALPGALTSAYLKHVRQKVLLLAFFLGALLLVALFALTQGAYDIPVREVLSTLTGSSDAVTKVALTNIRLPRVIAAIVGGWSLALAGLSIQALLKNPLGSPMTLGISHGAAFGAATAIVLFGAEIFSGTLFAFSGGMAPTLIILLLSRLKRLSPEAVILAGMTLSSLFFSASALLQYLASETELAMVVFWTFGDVARSNWRQIGLMAGAVFCASLYLLAVRWDLNVLASGDETAKGLGVNVERIRVTGMVVATFVAAMATAFHGVIAFVGLIAPHMARRLVGDDHRLLIPFASILGALLLLTADTVGRIFIGSGALPVGVVTSFLGAPMFLYLLMRGYR